MFCRSLDIDERQGFLMSFVSNLFTLNNEKYLQFFLVAKMILDIHVITVEHFTPRSDKHVTSSCNPYLLSCK